MLKRIGLLIKSTNNRLEKNIVLVLFTIIFCSIFVFFFYAHPIVIWDFDDWYYIANMRRGAFLNPFTWNPARVFGETSEAIVGKIAAFCIYPFIHDYVRSISLVMAVLLSGVITIYVYCFYDFLRREMKQKHFLAFMLSGIFLLLHFLIFRNLKSDNIHMFYATDLNCYFVYVIPFLLNGAAVLWMMTRNIEEYYNFEYLKENGCLITAIITLVLYFCLWSNLYQSVIIISFFLTEIIVAFVTCRFDFKVIIKHKLKCIYIFIWSISLLSEGMGGRAVTAYSKNTTVNLEIKNSLLELMNLFKKLNLLFLLLFFGCGLLAVVIAQKNKTKVYLHCATILIGVFIVSGTFCLFLNSLVNPKYSSRIDCMSSIFWCLILLLNISISLCVQQSSYIKLFLPVITYVILCETMYGHSTYADANANRIRSAICYEIDKSIIEQLKFADKQGKENAEIYIPDLGGCVNVDQFREFDNRISEALYSHGILNRIIETKFVVD